MTMYMPPIARKKRVSGHYDPDSFRVISGDAEEMHPKFVTTSIEDHADFRRETPAGGLTLPNIYNRQTEVLPKSVPDYRVNRPHPGSCGFLRHNVRVLNEPVCSVYTASSHDEQNLWWPSRTSNEPLNVPPKTKDTVYRGDYMQDGDRIQSSGSTRHSANLHRDPALGTVPVNFLPARNDNKRFFKEKISYEHQYNSRLNPNYPTRAKKTPKDIFQRHGSFVWDQMSNAESKQMMEEQTALNEAECKENAQSQTHPRPISNTTSSSAPPPSQQDSTPPTEVVPEKKTVTFQSPIDKENEKIHK
ncbi:uncharacterized protein C2orf73 homolog isoform X1 [Mizuhopecten yessoensis]|uniref:uncharacterized protein C2orf73 homolog isoform X1 n=1 Tax=Mizuhopecten yessoensis TaxID=6573 RepID=UPI000B45D437|nr:uncharacterized protein C2orf73 homolog isoform X1 [Mizuhopecten yessoensis]